MRDRFSRLLVAFTLVVTTFAPVAAQDAASDQTVPNAATATVNINTATPMQLVTLPGIGERTAQRIIEYRTANGPFKKVEDLMNVSGIGEKSFLRLKPLITVTPARAERSTTPSV